MPINSRLSRVYDGNSYFLPLNLFTFLATICFMDKDFDSWNVLKKRLDSHEVFLPIKEGEVWWCSVGANVGIEMCGKGQEFSRPVVVLKKLSRFGFYGVPLTSHLHEGSWFVEFEFKNRKQYASFAQVRIFSTNRLTNRMGTFPMSDYSKIKDRYLRLYK